MYFVFRFSTYTDVAQANYAESCFKTVQCVFQSERFRKVILRILFLSTCGQGSPGVVRVLLRALRPRVRLRVRQQGPPGVVRAPLRALRHRVRLRGRQQAGGRLPQLPIRVARRVPLTIGDSICVYMQSAFDGDQKSAF